MTIYSPEEANEAAAYIQAMHRATRSAWMRVLAITPQMHIGEQRRRRQEYERQVEAFNQSWQGE